MKTWARVISVMLSVTCAGGCDDPATPATSPPKNVARVADDKIESSLAAAQQYLQSGEIGKAEAIIRTLVDRAPSEPRGHETLGQVLLAKGDDAERIGDVNGAATMRKDAYACYREATRLDPGSAGLQHSAGVVAMTAGVQAAAIEHFNNAEKLDATNPQYPLFAAQALIQQQRLDEAEQALTRAIGIDADEPYAHASMAMIALERQQFEKALAEMARARAALPDDAGLRAQQARIHRRMNEPHRALELLIGLDAASRGQEAVAFEVAAAFDMLGDPRRAAYAWEHCYSANPRSPRGGEIALHAGNMYLKADSLREAMNWADHALRYPDTRDAALKLIDQIREKMPPPVP